MNYTPPPAAFDIPAATADQRHDRETRRAIVVVTVLLWAANYGVLAVRSMLSPGGLTLEVALLRVVLTAIGCAFCYLIHRIIKRLGNRPFHQRAIVVAVLAPIVADAYSWIGYFGYLIVTPENSDPGTPSSIIFAIVFWVWFYLAWSALYLALIYSAEAHAQERRSAEIQAQAHSAQLRALRYQVNPHFLFNTLNSISALILDRKLEQAEAMVARLSDFFRSNLSLDPLEDVPLANEMTLQHLYLEIEQVRFPDLTVTIDLPEQLRGALVPSLILQPLIENAVKYAVAGSDGPTRITVTAREENGWLVLEVADDGQSGHCCAKPGTGIGLNNVRERLSSRFGDVHWFEAAPRKPHGFGVSLGMPLRFAP